MKKTALFLLITGLFTWSCTGTDPDDANGNGNGGDPGGGTPSVVVDWSDAPWYTTNFWERTDREKEGLRGPVKKWHNSTYTTYDEFEYDRAGRLVKKTQVDTEKPGSEEWVSYSYDAQGHLVREEYWTKGENMPQQVTDYEYANTGRFVATDVFVMGPAAADCNKGIVKELSAVHYRVYQPITTTGRDESYVFNAQGNLEVSVSSWAQDVGSEEKADYGTMNYTVTYQSDGYPHASSGEDSSIHALEVSYYPNGMYKDFKFKEVNSYNFETGWDVHAYHMLDNPRYLRTESFKLLEGKPSSISLTPGWTRYSFNEHWEPLKREDGYEDAETVSYEDRYGEYVYDKYGNWTSCRESKVGRWDGNRGESTITRVFEYFQ